MNNEKNIFSDTYEIIGYLQSGSGGAVYKAYHKRLKKEMPLVVWSTLCLLWDLYLVKIV